VRTARFAQVVQTCGQPEVYLLLMDPKKDRSFQAAVKAQRVMTVHQDAVGTKSDRGEVGFAPGSQRQFLLFPRSLRAFAGRAVVGIKYDLLGSRDIPRSERASPPQAPKKPKRPVVSEQKINNAESENVIAFRPAPKEDEDEDEALVGLKKQVRRAMALLEEGKAVAAFNLLKRIVGD
jgi:hypothetical protein